jgi:parvulin-like peptidyl-prolyl isomerase
MRRLLQLAVIVTCLAGLAQSGEVLDRIVAIVNNTPIFQSEWEMALRCEALLDGRNPESFNEGEQRAVFERLVDQELLQEQMRGFMMAPVTDDEVNARLQDVRSQIAAAKSQEGWARTLAKAGVTGEDLNARIRTQLQVLRFLDTRFRPTVRVEYRTIQKYYREEFLPELHKHGGQEMQLSEAAPKIREILMQQRMDEQVTSWLQTLREQADIRIPSAPKDAEVSQRK